MDKSDEAVAEWIVSVNEWIKKINHKLSVVEDDITLMYKNENNIDHNYELIGYLKHDIKKLESEIRLLRIAQILEQGVVKNETQQS